MDTTHVAVVYNLGGETPDFQDYDDNGEIGFGTRALKQLQTRKFINVAIYMVRYHSGNNLGQRRFEIFKEQTDQVLELLQNPDNFYTSRCHKSDKRLRTPKSRSRGKITGVRGGASFA